MPKPAKEQSPYELINPQAHLAKLLFSTHLETKSTREGFTDALLELGQENDQVVALSADLSKSTGTHKFEQAFSKRFFQVGVAEQNMTSIGAGLALSGKTVFIASYAAFSPGRNFDFIRTQICYSNANVKIVATHAGLSASYDGATHQMLEDIALMRTLPNITIFTPSDYFESYKAVKLAAQLEGPAYIRLYRDPTPVFTSKESPYKQGIWNTLRFGHSACLIAYGPSVYTALHAAKTLEEKGVSVQVVSATSAKPLDEMLLLEIASKCPTIFTLEEHQIAGGLGGAICEFLSLKKPTRVIRLGIQDVFGESGKYSELQEKHNIDEKGVVQSVLQYL